MKIHLIVKHILELLCKFDISNRLVCCELLIVLIIDNEKFMRQHMLHLDDHVR